MGFSDYQMLCASSIAYEINNGIFIPPTSGAAYEEYRALGVVLDVKAIQFGEAVCLLLETEQGIIIAFRGTISHEKLDCPMLDDWLTNLQFNFTHWEGNVEVHSGFAFELHTIFDEINSTIKNWGTTKKLYITGHSQGGGVAVLAAYKLKEIAYDVEKVVVFAAPSAGGKSFMERYNNDLGLESKTTRYQHAGDIVPMLPPDMGSVPTTQSAIVQNIIEVLIEAITKANYIKDASNVDDSCILFGLRSFEMLLRIFKSIKTGTASTDIKAAISYYSVGRIKFIEFNNKIEPQISYFSQVLNLLAVFLEGKGGSFGDCHSLRIGYAPALKK
ncbi:lipase family protein [Aureispira sp. CCB-E]|uniref:lipase family protein n=1 Tax=Aureispira sp. CCB-E TaxID=3051121 RepID=UPI0028697175|nr:lipase family protein [Aureispira sp. CCB-E]WMX13096.1 lipase family protein [Aureispira sp. CCB-E]